jgi:uncharacterized surface protein with fasciclin (FAS1) repeats
MRIETAEGFLRPRALTVAAIAATVALTAAGCGTSGTSGGSGAPGTSATHHPMAEHHSMHHSMTEAAMIGSDCGMVPTTGMGSFHSMSMDPVVTAAMHSPLLTAFAADAKAAGLTGDLNSMHAITVFAPENSAFSGLSRHDMHMMMHSPSDLASILKYHIVDSKVTPAELTSGMSVTTLAGGSLKLSKMGSVYEVNNADVVCGNIPAANATIYVINKVLMPMHHSM